MQIRSNILLNYILCDHIPKSHSLSDASLITIQEIRELC